MPTSGSSPPWSWRCWPPRSPCRPTTPPPGACSRRTPAWPCASPASPAAGATTSPPRTPPPSRRSWPCTAAPAAPPPTPDDVLPVDLLSAEGGTAALGDEARAMAALSSAPRSGWADTPRSPLVGRAQGGLDVQDGGAVDRLQVADGDGVVVDAHDGDRVQPDRVGAVRRPGREHALAGPVGVAARVDRHHVAAALVEPGQHQHLVADAQVGRGLADLGAEDHPGRRRPSSPCLGARSRSVSGDSTQ